MDNFFYYCKEKWHCALTLVVNLVLSHFIIVFPFLIISANVSQCTCSTLPHAYYIALWSPHITGDRFQKV